MGTTNEDRITLKVDTSNFALPARTALHSRNFSTADGAVSLATQLHWPPPPVGASAGYTAHEFGDSCLVLPGTLSAGTQQHPKWTVDYPMHCVRPGVIDRPDVALGSRSTACQ